MAARSAGVRLRGLTDLARGRAIHHDFTNPLLQARGFSVSLLSPEEAAGRLAAMAETYDLTCYDFIQTDLAGHAQDMDRAVQVIEGLNGFVSTLAELLNRARNLLVLVSDHGNVEDLSTATHTWNRVPPMVWGKGKERFARRIHALTDITPSLLTVWNDSKQPSTISYQQSPIHSFRIFDFGFRI